MKFSCKTPDILHALQLVSRAISAQQALPILGNILIEAEGKRCRVSATDLELSIVTSFPATIENEGTLTIPAKAILNFAQYTSDPEVVLETVEGTQLKCVSKHSRTTIAGEASSEYPTIASIEKQKGFTLESTSLLQALNLVTFASARTSLRPVLSGVFIRSHQGKLILVATDSYRLSEFALPAPGDGGDVSCIVPVKVLEELKSILTAASKKPRGSDADAPSDDPAAKVKAEAVVVDVTLGSQQIEFSVGNTRLLSRLIDGKFPEYQQIIPKEFNATVNLPVSTLTTTVKRMHYFAKEMNNSLTFKCKADETAIITPKTQAGRDEAVIPGGTKGKECIIALSSSYLLDFLAHAPGDEVAMRVNDSMHPAVFNIAGIPSFLHLIMPLRLQQEE